MNCTLTSAAVWVGGWVGGRREREVGRVVILPPPPFEALSRPGSPFPARLFPNSCHRRDPTVAARGVQDVIVVGRNFRGTTCTRKGTRGPPVLQVCVCVVLACPQAAPSWTRAWCCRCSMSCRCTRLASPPPLHSASWTTSNSAGGSCTWCVPLAVSFGCSCSGSCS